MTVPNVDIKAVSDDQEGPDYEALAAFLDGEESRADDGETQEERAAALDAYNGLPYGDEEEGRSQVVTRDVAEVVDTMTAELVRVMVGTDRAVEIQVPEADQQQERQPGQPKPPSLSDIVTAAVSQEFYQGQDGYTVIHDWIKAGLLEKTSTCKVCVEEQDPIRREAVLTVEQMIQMESEGAKFIAAVPMDATETQFGVAWLEEQPPIFRDYVTPNEEFKVAMDARDLDKDCVYSAYVMPKTITDIAEMGLPIDDIADDGYSSEDDILRAARDKNRGDPYQSGDYRTGSNRRVWLREEYAKYDVDGDGLSELIKVFRVGTHILDAEPVDEQPGVVWCPYRMPGRIIGQSLADKTMDIQRVNSVVMRQTLDGFYLANKPRTYLSESAMGVSTVDDLLNPNIGSIIRYVGQVAPATQSSNFDMSAPLALMEKLMGDKESRTGITRLNQGMDQDALNKTASGTKAMMQKGELMSDYVARNFAEAFARLMLKKYRLMRKFGRPMDVVVDGEVVRTDPRTWPESAKTAVRVGLGSGNKDQRIAYRMQLLGIAQEALAGGSRTFNDETLYNNIKGFIADTNLGTVRDLAVDPASLPPEEEKPDPAMVEVQAKAQLEAAKIDQQAQQAQAENALKAQQNDYDLQAKREKAALDENLARQKAEFEADLAERQFAFESALAMRQAEFNEEMARHSAAVKAEQDALPKKREGGDLDK